LQWLEKKEISSQLIAKAVKKKYFVPWKPNIDKNLNSYWKIRWRDIQNKLKHKKHQSKDCCKWSEFINTRTKVLGKPRSDNAISEWNG